VIRFDLAGSLAKLGHSRHVLDLITQALLASYETYGGINHLDGANLPSEESVNRLASDLMHVLFPGFFEQSSLTKQNIGAVTERRLGDIATRLVTELEKCMRFAHDPEPDLHAREHTEISSAACRRCGRSSNGRDAAYHGDPAARSVEEIILATLRPGHLAAAHRP